LNRLASFSVTLISCVKGTCVLGLSGGTALGMGLGIDELLISYGREPIFRDTLGNGLDKALNSMGFENPNKDTLPKYDLDLKTLKHKYKALNALNEDIDELNSISDKAGANDSEFIKEIKNDLKRRIEDEKRSITESKSKILSQLNNNNPFNTKK
jgi:gas vesicle protein